MLAAARAPTSPANRARHAPRIRTQRIQPMAARPSNPWVAAMSSGPECMRSKVTPGDQSPLRNRPKASPVVSSPQPVRGRAEIMCNPSCQRWILSGPGSSLRKCSGDTMIPTSAAPMTATDAIAAPAAVLPLRKKTTRAKQPARAPSPPLREVVATRPPAITATPNHHATMKRPPRQPRAMARGNAIAIKAPSRLALPRFPSGRYETCPAHCTKASRHATAVPKTNDVTTHSRWRFSRKSQTAPAKSPR